MSPTEAAGFAGPVMTETKNQRICVAKTNKVIANWNHQNSNFSARPLNVAYFLSGSAIQPITDRCIHRPPN